jgi:hypothetical protein
MDDGGNGTNVQCKSNQNCHYESQLYNKYILIKIYKKREFSGFFGGTGVCTQDLVLAR